MVRSERTTRRFYGGVCGKVHAPVSMLFPPIDPNERFRERRAAARRRKRLRGAAALGSVLVGGAAPRNGRAVRRHGATTPQTVTDLATLASSPSSGPRTLPIELRGVHVTMGLASLPGKLDEYLDLERDGLTALELDVKDENGEVGFITAPFPGSPSRSAPPATTTPRARPRRGRTSAASTSSGASSSSRIPFSRGRGRTSRSVRPAARVWRDAAGLGWTNPYDRRVWEYNVDIAVAAAKAGFDEIMFDYVRFPSDGDVDGAVYRNAAARSRSARRFRRSCGTRGAGSTRSASGSRPLSSASRARGTSASASFRARWRRTSTPSTR